MVRIRIRERGDLGRDLRQMADRARDLSPVAEEITTALVRQNEAANFQPEHPNSILESDGTTHRIGARAPRESYADVLEVDEDELGDIQKRFIVEGK